MTKRLLPLALVILAAPAVAQETYGVAGNAGQVVELTAMVDAANGTTCESWALAVGCNQAAACSAASAAGGSGCTPAQARNAKARIWPNTFAGREEFVIWTWNVPQFLALKAELVKRNQTVASKFWSTASLAEKNAVCAAYNLAPGCILH